MSKNTNGRRLGALPKSHARAGAKRRPKAVATVGAIGLAAVFGAVWWQSNAAKEVSVSEVWHIHGIAVDRNNPQALLLATHYGLYRAEGGMAQRIKADESNLEWETLNNGFGDRALLHLAVDPSNPDRLFAVNQDGQVLESSDSGRNWQAFTS